MDRAPTPYAIVAQMAFGSHLRTMRIPEARIPHATQYGWVVLIRDSEMPPHVPDTIWSPLSGSDRRAWLREQDVREFDDDEGYTPDDRYDS